MEEIRPEDYAEAKASYLNTIRQMAKASVHDSFRSLVFANNSLSLGLQAFGVDVAGEVAASMEEELQKILKTTKKYKEVDNSQIHMEFYPKTGENNEYKAASSGSN